MYTIVKSFEVSSYLFQMATFEGAVKSWAPRQGQTLDRDPQL